jgi:hypothetical protein
VRTTSDTDSAPQEKAGSFLRINELRDHCLLSVINFYDIMKEMGTTVNH